MFYPNQFVELPEEISSQSLLEKQWQQVASNFNLKAIFLLNCNIEYSFFTVESTFNIPLEPFNGADKECLTELVDDCFQKHAKPHVHSLSDKKIVQRLQRFNQSLTELRVVWFYPIKVESYYFIFLGIPDQTAKRELPQTLHSWLLHILFAYINCLNSVKLFNRLKATEVFVKEIGHDIASSVQATVAKLRNITDRRITGDTIIRKSRETEEEMWAAYRVSESLGIVVDPNYELKEPKEFNLTDSLKTARQHFLSEAEEKHMKLNLEADRPITFWGDKRAIEQAIEQLLSNAIKYGDGGSSVAISATERRDDILIRVANKGIPLPTGPELYYIWDFGVRGKTAKELHVNGSGIGLYSVKKITRAHSGKNSASSENGITSFFIYLPTPEKMKKLLGMLL